MKRMPSAGRIRGGIDHKPADRQRPTLFLVENGAAMPAKGVEDLGGGGHPSPCNRHLWAIQRITCGRSIINNSENRASDLTD